MTVPKAKDRDRKFLSLKSFFIDFAYWTLALDFIDQQGSMVFNMKYNKTKSVGIKIKKNSNNERTVNYSLIFSFES